MNKRQVKKGVSLITLIITIVVVIIISAVAINSVFRQNVIDKAKFAVSESNRVLGIEKLRTEEISYFLENGSQVATIEGFVDYLDSKGIISKEETEFEGDNKATVILDNKAVYEIEKNSNGSIDITYVGQAGSLVPLLQISVTSATTNEITVSPTVLKRNEGGTLKYYIKQQSEENYEYKGETSNTSYTYTGLEKNKVYDIKVIAENTEGLQTEATTTAVTIDIVQPDVTFTYDPDGWTNGDVKVTAVATSTPNGMTLYIGESISSCSELASTGITVTSNKPVYAVFKDSTGQYGGAAIGNVEYIDKVVPVINSIDVTTNTLTINATDSGGSNLAKYAISTVDVEPDENDFQVSNVFSVSQNTPYYAWAMDGAGNVSASATNTTATIQTPEVTFTYDQEGWTNKDVKVTAVATSTPTGMTLYIGESVSSCDTLASTGITVTSNKPVYAVFKDSSGQYGGAAIGNVEYIDKVVPVINSIDVTTNTLTINATDSGGSNLAKYAISTANTQPDENSFQTSNVFSVSQGVAYFAWAMDGAGNVSEVATNTTATVQTPVVTFTYDQEGWTNKDVKVTAVATSTPEGMTLYIGESVSSCDTLASAGITVTSNKPVYAVFKDSSGQYGGAATGNVEYIDKVVPVINSIDVTTNTLTINASDSGGSNLAKYAISTVDVEPDENDFQVSNVFSVSQTTAYFAWAMDGAGNVSASATNTTATIQTPTVTFTYDPSGWTNEDVTVTAVASSTPEGMTLYIGESVSSCDTLASAGITVTSNKPVYAVFKDSSGQFGGEATGNVEYIDKTIPVINSIDVTTNTLTINASDSGGSNLAKYAISTVDVEPDENDFQVSNVFSVSQGVAYYAWAMDGAGNVSVSATNTTATIQTPTVTFTYDPSGWTNKDVKVTAVATSTPAGMTLYIGESISSCSTLASTGITVTSNKPVYAVFKDSSEQFGGAATGNVEYIDKAVPSITTTSNSGAYDITIKGRDTLAGINAYYYSTSNSTPSLTAATSSTQAINKWVTFTASTSEISKTLTGFTSEGTYYYWFKDQAGNISARGTFTTTKVPASSVKYVPETSGWNSGDVQDAIDKLYEKFN